MPTFLMPPARQRGWSNAGAPAAGCKLYTYAAGTTTPKATYQDAAGTIPHENPITLDAKGEALIYWDGNYRVDLRTAAGAQITGYPVDNFQTPIMPDSLALSNGGGMVGFSYASTYPAGSMAKWLQDLSQASSATLVGYSNASTGAVGTTIQKKLRERISLLDFMDAETRAAVAGGAYTANLRAKMLTATNAAWTAALAGPFDLFAPAGRYELANDSFPWRQQIVTELLDCKNVTLYCDGPSTVFATVSTAGADVFQLNGLKNFHVIGFPTLTASLTGTAGAGSNGCSVTNGFDNITLELSPTNCQSIDKPTYIDGGKGLTIQCDAATLEVGSLKARVRSKQCAQGFGFEAGLVNFLSKKVAVDIDLQAEDCFVACSIGAGAATSAIPAGTHTGVSVRGQAINCQKDVILGRAHGVAVNMQVITTKTAIARRLDPRGNTWHAADQIVEVLLCNYAKNSQVTVVGSKGDCDYKARIGATTAGSSGQTGATQYCNIFVDVGGTAAVADIFPIDSGGNVMSDSSLTVTGTTASALGADFYSAARNNTITVGPARRLMRPKFAGRTSFALEADGTTESAAIDAFGQVVGLQGHITAAANKVVTGLYDYSGNFRLGVVNGNGMAIDGISTTAAIGTYVGKYAVYGPTGLLIGYLPIYN